MTPIEISTLIKDAVVAIAAAVTATVAVRGLSTWNRELRGKATFEVARSLAKAAYRLRDEINLCRTPFLAAAEFPEGYGSKKTAAEVANGLAHVYGTRWNKVWDALQNFDTNTLEAEAIWGAEVRVRTDALRRCVTELRIAIDAMIEDAAVGGANFDSDKAFGLEMRSKVSTASSKDNTLTKNIESAIKGIEAVVQPHLRRA
jgi:hypothetical protein